MNFFNIQIGSETRKGNFIENHSFVCQSENTQNEVYKHYLNKYNGFVVICKDIKKVETLTAETILDTNRFGQNKYDTEISKLKREISNLKSSKKNSIIYRSLDKSYFPKETKLALVEYEKFKSEALKQKEIAISHIKTYLLNKYDGFTTEAYVDDGFSQHNSTFSYKITLNGQISHEFESNK